MADGGVSGSVVAIFTALFAVAIVAVLVSQNAQTSKILQAIGTSTSSTIGAAVSPVTQSGSGH